MPFVLSNSRSVCRILYNCSRRLQWLDPMTNLYLPIWTPNDNIQHYRGPTQELPGWWYNHCQSSCHCMAFLGYYPMVSKRYKTIQEAVNSSPFPLMFYLDMSSVRYLPIVDFERPGLVTARQPHGARRAYTVLPFMIACSRIAGCWVHNVETEV